MQIMFGFFFVQPRITMIKKKRNEVKEKAKSAKEKKEK